MKKGIVFFIISFFIIGVSCKKHLGDKPPASAPAPEVPDKDSWLANVNREIASILEQVYRNDSAYAEVNATIFSEYYVDERVLLRDLLFPQNSDLYRLESFRKFNTSGGVFKRIFNEVMNKGDYPLLKKALSEETNAGVVPKTSVVENNISLDKSPSAVLSGETAAAIYFPYSTNFLTAGASSAIKVQGIARPTIVAADREANSAPGKEPYSCASGTKGICYKDVIVDDDYATAVPTHIVENGARPTKIGLDPFAPSLQLTRVYLGWARLTRQMDALISFTGNGGGSEIKVARLSGYLKMEGQQVTDFSGDLVTLDFSRADIRKQTWKRVYSVWDPNWDKENLQQIFAVYEDDTKGTKTFSGSLSTTVNVGTKPVTGKVEGSLSYKVEVSTQDEIITQRKWDRSSFFKDGKNDQGWGFFPEPNDFLSLNQDWPIYDCGTIWQFSMPWRIY
jgi:hypothetical protein